MTQLSQEEKKHLVQGFLNSDKNRNVRVRIDGLKSFLTVKGLSNDSGTTRFEWEKEIPLKEAQELIALCLSTIIEKTRYEVTYKGVFFEVDEFKGSHNVLVLAEVELNSSKEFFEIPKWIDK